MSNQQFLLKSYVPSILEQIDSNLQLEKEFEVRFTQFVKEKTRSQNPKESDSPLDYNGFFRLKNYFLAKYGTPKEIHSQDKIQNGKRQSLIVQEDGSEKIVIIEKKQIWNSKTEDYNNTRRVNLFDELGLKMSLSSETQTEGTEFTRPEIVRNKHRYTWRDDSFQFDLTRITSEENQQIQPKYEFEIEIIHPVFVSRTQRLTHEEKESVYTLFYKLFIQITALLCVLNNTDLAYKKREKERIEKFVRETANESNSYSEDRFLTKARNLKYEDMVYGGLVGGAIRYTVTPKAEGIRKFLIIDDYGVWLMYPNNYFCLVERSPTKNEEYMNWKWFPFRGTILDGEDVPPEHRVKGMTYADIKHFYIPFDTLWYKREDVRDRDLQERQKLALILQNTVGSSSVLVLKSKPFLPLGRTSEEFFSNMTSMFEMIKDVEYKTDGFVFTPINTEYNTFTAEKVGKKDKDRILSKYPDLCKWKPKNEYTIDLKLDSSKMKLYSSKGDIDELFEGSNRFPFDAEKQVDWYDPMFNHIPNKSIIEFGPKLNSSGEKILTSEGDIILKPIRIRSDKPYPNGSRAATETWDQLNDPITQETLLGKTTRLVRKYHNQVKRKILQVPGTDNHLVDIGSGRGGDITKMRSFSRILSIEPNEENMKEFRRRLLEKDSATQAKFSTLVAGGEEYEKIMDAIQVTFGEEFGKKPLYISMMLSLSFFWKSEEMLQQLSNTLNSIKEEYYRRTLELKIKSPPTVKFLFLTIEGNKTFQFFEKNGEIVQLNDCLFSYKNRVVYVDFEDSIVEKQTEYLVNLEDLREITDMNMRYEKDATEEKFLSEKEKIYTSLYVYGEYELPNKPIYIFRKKGEIVEESIEKEIEEAKETESSIFIINPTEIGLPIHSTLFACLFDFLRVDKTEKLLADYVLLYRKEISEAVSKTNPFDIQGRIIFESAGQGFLQNLNSDIDFHKAWIFSENELPPDYISWLPDVIGVNIDVNGKMYQTSLPSSETVYLDYEPLLNVYSLRM